MLCCLVLLTVVGFVFRRRAADEPFPPAARWGSTSQPRRAAVIPQWPLWPGFLRGAAVGVLVYVVVVTLLLATGIIEAAASSDAAWVARDAALALLALAGLLISAHGDAVAPHSVRTTATALVGGGVAWTVAGIVDMHLFAMFEFVHEASLHDPVFHAAGFWAVVAGTVLLHSAETRRVAPRPAVVHATSPRPDTQ
jgi:hypothetical protein